MMRTKAGSTSWPAIRRAWSSTRSTRRAPGGCEQLVRGGEPAVRLLAVRALGRTGNLDYVPTLIYALTDPDRDVVLEARDALEFVSRRFDGFGPPDGFTEKQRFDAVEAWKNWYRSLRPGAMPRIDSGARSHEQSQRQR